jgi:quercetin dioxygenase-like cupin family protein
MNRIKDVKPKHVVPGITGHYVHGELHTFGYVVIKKGSIVPEHHHPQEQITFVVEGQLDMVIGGEPHSLTACSYHIIHSNVRHSAVAPIDCVVIDTFSPVREDYKNLDSAAFSLSAKE